jgi:hypothetical protein
MPRGTPRSTPCSLGGGDDGVDEPSGDRRVHPRSAARLVNTLRATRSTPFRSPRAFRTSQRVGRPSRHGASAQ